MLNKKGQCCGRKPLVYKTSRVSTYPHRFCPKCDRSYELDSDKQIENYFWEKNEEGIFVKVRS